MPFLKDGSFLLDDSTCNPYGTADIKKKVKSEKKEAQKSTKISNKSNKKGKK